MTGFTPERPYPGRLLVGAALSLAAAFALSACNGMTYGTGTSPGMQTLEDIAGIAAMSGKKKEPIDYTPRPKVVLPPSVAQLPSPGSENTAVAANWPVDPDQQRTKIRAEADAREAAGVQAEKGTIPIMGKPKPGQLNASQDNPDDTPTAEEQAAAKKLYAEVKGISVDANGQPMRRYLSDPPADYRVPDPTAPLEITDKPKKKKFKWWWQ